MAENVRWVEAPCVILTTSFFAAGQEGKAPLKLIQQAFDQVNKEHKGAHQIFVKYSVMAKMNSTNENGK